MRKTAVILISMLLAAPAIGQSPAWREIEGVWRVEGGNELCPAGALWAYAFSDDGGNMVLWTQGSMIEPPVVIPERLGSPPRLQGRAPFYNTRILERRGHMIRTRHETLRLNGDTLTVDYGNLRCRARRAN